MKIGQYITFDLDRWYRGLHKTVEFKNKIIDICNDPLKLHESKCGVEVNGEHYGIPFSEVKQVFPADGEQLNLF